MASYATCPSCEKVFRPKSVLVNACWDSVSAHISEKSRRGCPKHMQIHSALYRRPFAFGCAGCSQTYGTKQEALYHLHITNDQDHAPFKGPSELHPSAPLVASRNRVAEQFTELYSAAKSGQTEKVRQLLDAGVDCNQSADDGFTPLMTASEAGHARTVAVLVQHPPCEINRRNAYGQTALHLAAQNGQAEAILEILGVMEFKSGSYREILAGGRTPAAAARAAGHGVLADLLADSARQGQLDALRAALEATDNPAAAGPARFDSLADRARRLVAALGLPNALAPPADQDWADPARAGRLECAVCMAAGVQAAVRPCFHAALCLSCADRLRRPGSRCPICRGPAEGVQRIYLS